MNNTMPPPTLSMIAANLLRNSCFFPGYIINQRGVASGSISNSSNYFIDSWMTYQSALNNLTYTFATNGMKIAVSTGSGGIGQRLEFALETGKSYTLAAKVDDVVYALQITGGTSCNQNVTSTTTLAYVTDYGGYNTVRVYFTGVTTRTITWVALHEGAYTDNTLPPYVPPDPTTELAKCRRYYYQEAVYNCFLTAQRWSDTQARMTYNLPVQMRIRPTVTMGGSGYLAIKRVDGSSTQYQITSIQANSMDGSTLGILLYTSGLTDNAVYGLYGQLDGTCILQFSAEL